MGYRKVNRLAALVPGLFVVLLLLTPMLIGCEGVDSKVLRYLERGRTLFKEGNYVKAELEFKNVLQIEPNNIDAMYMLGQVAVRQQNWQLAFSAFSTALNNNPAYVPAMVARGNLYRLSGSTQDALDIAEEALQIQPSSVDALLLRAATQNQIGMTELAIRDARKVLEIEPDDMVAFSLLVSLLEKTGDKEGAIIQTRAAVAQHPDSSELHQLLAYLYDKAGKPEQAQEQFRQVIDLGQEDLQAWSNLAAHYSREQNTDLAEQVLRDAIQANPKNPGAKLQLVGFLANHRSRDLAEQQLKKYIAAEPGAYPLRFGLAQLYLPTNRPEQAKGVYREIIARDELGPDALEARTKLARLLYSEGKQEEVSKLIDLVLEQTPGDVDALVLHAGIALARQQPDQAITDAHRMLGSSPIKREEFQLLDRSVRNVMALRLLANGYIQKQAFGLARLALDAAVATSPLDVGANLELAQLMVVTGDTAGAEVTLVKLLQVVPNNYQVLLALGEIQAEQQSWSTLKDTAGRLKAEFPNSPFGHYFMGLAYKHEKSLQASVGEFKKAEALKPGAFEPLLEMAKLEVQLGQPETALERLRKLLEANPGNPLALNLQGQVLQSQKRFDEAESVFRKIIEEYPQWVKPYDQLAKLYISRKMNDQAIKVLQAGVEAADSVSLRSELASRYLELGDAAAAIAQYEVILERPPRLILAANNLALLILRDHPDQVALDRALELVKGFEQSNNPVFLDTLGWVHYTRGEYGVAVAILERAIEHGSNYQEIEYHLGMAYLKQGRIEEARVSLQKSLQAAEAGLEWAERARELLEQVRL